MSPPPPPPPPPLADGKASLDPLRSVQFVQTMPYHAIPCHAMRWGEGKKCGPGMDFFQITDVDWPSLSAKTSTVMKTST